MTDRTPRQRQVLELIADGYTNGQIAEALGISFAGAKWHVSEVISRLGVSSREEAGSYWRPAPRLRRAGWHARIDLDRWWAGLPAADVTAEHAWATATLRLTAFAAGDGGRWLVRGQARARGRSWGRLVVAVALLVGRRALAEAFGRAMDDAARSWDEALDRWAGADPAEVARALLASAGGRIGDGDAPGGAQ